MHLSQAESNALHFCLYFQQASIVSSTTSVYVVLIEEANYLPGHVFPPRFFMVHDTRRGREDDVAKLTGRKQLNDPLLEIGDTDIVTRRYHAGFIDTMETRHSAALQNVNAHVADSEGNIPSVELDNDLARTVIIHFFEFSNIT